MRVAVFTADLVARLFLARILTLVLESLPLRSHSILLFPGFIVFCVDFDPRVDSRNWNLVLVRLSSTSLASPPTFSESES